MKGEDFLRELNSLEDSIIEEAKEPIVRKKRKVNGNIIKFVGLAACITVFTGAIIARSIGVKTEKEIYPAKENKTIEKEESITENRTEETESASDMKSGEKKQIVWKNYDLNQDGITDTITIDIPADYESRMAGCTITDGSSQNVIYQHAFSFSYPDWGELYLLEQEGMVYLIEYKPVLYQGMGEYQYDVFCFNQKSEKIMLSGGDIFFDLTDRENNRENTEKMAEFYYEVNNYLSNAMLLISTVHNKMLYSEETNRISKQEEYEFLYEYNLEYTQENMYERLDEYFSYLNEQMQYAENHIELVLLEDTLTPSGASFEIINTSGMDGYSGEAFRIEEFEKKQWKMRDYVSDDVAFEDLKWAVNDGNPYSFSVDWSNIYGKLENGSYRLVKNVSFSENISVEAVCYFDIDNPDGTDLSNTADGENATANVVVRR